VFRFLGKYFAWLIYCAIKLHCSSHIIAGLAASAPIAVVGGSINDLFSDRERALAMSIYTFMPIIGAYIKYLSILLSLMILFQVQWYLQLQEALLHKIWV